jgi:hypothetical protein
MDLDWKEFRIAQKYKLVLQTINIAFWRYQSKRYAFYSVIRR